MTNIDELDIEEEKKIELHMAKDKKEDLEKEMDKAAKAYLDAKKEFNRIDKTLDEMIDKGASEWPLAPIREALPKSGNALDETKKGFDRSIETYKQAKSDLDKTMKSAKAESGINTVKEKAIDLKEGLVEATTNTQRDMAHLFTATMREMKAVVHEANEEFKESKDKAAEGFMIFKDVPLILEAARRVYDTQAIKIDKQLMNTLIEYEEEKAERQVDKPNLKHERQMARREIFAALKHFVTGKKQEPVQECKHQ